MDAYVEEQWRLKIHQQPTIEQKAEDYHMPTGFVRYLNDNYPDCGHWFSELNKVTGWLEQKWRPLTQNLGLEKNDEINNYNSNNDNNIELDKNARIRGLPSNCVAIIYLKKRSTQYEKYFSLLKTYFTHRLQFTSAFHHNPIHRELVEHYEERLKCLTEDAGYFNVIGNRLIQVINQSLSSGRSYTLNPITFTTCINDSSIREQCLHALLPSNEVKNIKNQKKKITNELLHRLNNRSSNDNHSVDSQLDDEKEEQMDSELEFDSDCDKSVELDEKHIIDSKIVNQSSCDLPNRPISKEVGLLNL
ncbi:unnamed protein product [Schistosoma turkestanicum]|nr:unnamed protein product [Schistosoma turkestanicum]